MKTNSTATQIPDTTEKSDPIIPSEQDPKTEAKKTFHDETQAHLGEITRRLADADVLMEQDKVTLEENIQQEKGGSEEAVEVLVSCCNIDSVVLEHMYGVLHDMQLNKAVQALEEVTEQKYQQHTNTDLQEPAQVTRSYKAILQESSGTFIDTLHLDRALLNHLQKRSVLNEDMIWQIMSRPNRPRKVKELMTLLMELGPHSVTAFVEALRATEQHFLANILSEYVLV